MQVAVNLEYRVVRDGTNVRGFHAKVFQSRPDLVSSLYVTQVGTEQVAGGTLFRTMGRLLWDPLQFGARDSILIQKLDYEKSPMCLCGKPIVNWEHVTGCYPSSLNFPDLWNQWVWNKAVRKSAIDHIKAHAPKVEPFLDHYESILRQKHQTQALFDGWTRVAKDVLTPKKLKWVLEKTCCRYFSRTQVAAMPLRIAENMRVWWVPPLGKPVYQTPASDFSPVHPFIQVDQALELGQERMRMLS